MRVVIDAPVLGFGLQGMAKRHLNPPLWSPLAASDRVLQRLMMSVDTCLYDPRILAHYRAFLARPGWGFSTEVIARLLEQIERSGEPVVCDSTAAQGNRRLPFAEVYVIGAADYLITYDHDFATVGAWVRWGSAEAFLKSLGET